MVATTRTSIVLDEDDELSLLQQQTLLLSQKFFSRQVRGGLGGGSFLSEFESSAITGKHFCVVRKSSFYLGISD